jgi:hypothetical protein
MKCKPNRQPANSIRYTYSRYEYVSANILALMCYPPLRQIKQNTKKISVDANGTR